MIESQQERSQHHRNEDGEEKRMIDLVVGLIAEKVQEIVSTELDRRLDRSDLEALPPSSHNRPPESEEF